jgi:hypothetical protein
MRKYNLTEKYKLYNKKYRESHRNYYREYNKAYREIQLGSASSEKIYKSKNLITDQELLHKEAEKIRNYRKRKNNVNEDYNIRDYRLNHSYYSADYDKILNDNYEDNI